MANVEQQVNYPSKKQHQSNVRTTLDLRNFHSTMYMYIEVTRLIYIGLKVGKDCQCQPDLHLVD